MLGTARRLGIEELIDPTPSRRRDLVTAMLVAQVIAPGSKLATARGLRAETATSSLGQVLGVAGCDEDDLYAAMDWALARKDAIENAFAARHLTNGTLVLYDVSSAAFEGRTCPLGAIGHPRDGVKGRLQIVYGLLCTTAGIPIAIEVFEGNTADPKTLAAQINKLKTPVRADAGCAWSVIGACSPTRASATRCAPRSWIGSARCAPRRSKRWSRKARCSCRCLMSRTSSRSAPRSFPASGWCAATTPCWPKKRTRKRARAVGRHRKRTHPHRRGHRPPAAAVARQGQHRAAGGQGDQPLQDGQTLHPRDHRRILHLHPQHRGDRRRGRPRRDLRAAHQPAQHTLAEGDVVLRYKDLEDVERFFRTLNTELDVRPIRHRLADRVRAHMFLRMLSYYLVWHMKTALAPILFVDNDKPAAAAKRANPVAAAQRSDDALAKAARKRTTENTPVHSFTSLLADLATLCANHIQPADDMPAFTMTTTPTPLQRRAFELLDVSHRHGLA